MTEAAEYGQLPVIIDCDPGQCDALALLLAMAFRDRLHLPGVMAVAGNGPLSLTEANAWSICKLAGRSDMPVRAGAEVLRARALKTAEVAYCKSGMGRVNLRSRKCCVGPPMPPALSSRRSALLAAPSPCWRRHPPSISPTRCNPIRGLRALRRSERLGDGHQ